MNRLKDVRIFAEARKCIHESNQDIPVCPLHSSDKTKGCCKDTHDLVKLDNAQNQTLKVELSRLFPDYFPVSFAPEISLTIHSDVFQKTSFHKPPPLSGPGKRVEFHSLLI
jgi:hypothetical protein